MPTPYTPETFKSYLITSLGDTAAFFGWTVDTPALDEVVNDVCYALGIDDIGDGTNFKQLRATGKYYAIQTALTYALTFYKFEVDGRSFERNKIVDNLRAALSILASDPNVVLDDTADDSGFLISTTKLDFINDPYSNDREPNYHLRPLDDEV